MAKSAPSRTPLPRLTVSPASVAWTVTQGGSPEAVSIKVSGPVNKTAKWSDQWAYCTVADAPQKTPCSFVVKPNAAVMIAKAGKFTGSATITVDGYEPVVVQLSLTVNAGETVPPPVVPPVTPPTTPPPTGAWPYPFVNEQPTIRFYPECWYMPFNLKTITIDSFAADGIKDITITLGNKTAVVTSADIKPDPYLGFPNFPCPITTDGLAAGTYNLTATARTNAGKTRTVSMPVTVNYAHPNFRYVKGGGDTLTNKVGNNVWIFYDGCEFDGDPNDTNGRIFRYLGNDPESPWKDVCWNCVTKNEVNGFRNCYAVYNGVAYDLEDDGATNVTHIHGYTEHRHNGVDGHPDIWAQEGQNAGDVRTNLIAYGITATDGINSAGVTAFSIDGMALVNFTLTNGGQAGLYGGMSVKWNGVYVLNSHISAHQPGIAVVQWRGGVIEKSTGFNEWLGYQGQGLSFR